MDTTKFSNIQFPAFGLEMNPPRGFPLFGFEIRLYGIVIAIGLLLAVMYGLKRSKQFGLKEDDILDGVLGIVPFAILCARLYYCIFSWDTYKANPISILYIWQGGLAIYGGVIGAAIGVVVFALLKRKKVRLTAVLDLVAIAFLIGQSIGRWGNFFNREAFGAETDSFLRMGLMNKITELYTYVHPTFLYESLWNLVGFIILHFLSKYRKYDGQIALGYVFWYGLGRTFIEGLRADSLMVGSLRVSQLLAAASCFVSATLLVLLAFKKHKKENLFVNIVAAREAEEASAEEAEDAEYEYIEVDEDEPEEEGAQYEYIEVDEDDEETADTQETPEN